MATTRQLDAIEIRVLGALMEKEQTTPDHYPLTISATVAACNQKSSRDPIMSLTETQVVEALDRLRLDVLAWRSEGARVERWEQRLDRRWHLSAASKAVMCVLMLRGPQSSGELKTRCARMHPFASREAVEEVLGQLAQGFDALVKELPRLPGHRDTRWTHLVGKDAPGSEAAEAAVAEAAGTETSRPVVAPAARTPEVVTPPVAEGPTSVERLERLEAAVAELRQELHGLRVRLGDVD